MKNKVGMAVQNTTYDANPSSTTVSGPDSSKDYARKQYFSIIATNINRWDWLGMLFFNLNIHISFHAHTIQTTEYAVNLEIVKSMQEGDQKQNVWLEVA